MITQGEKLPDIAMTMTDGSAVKPSDYLGQNWVLYFYPRDNTPGCTKEAIAFGENLDAFNAINTAILGVSKDSSKKHQNFIAKHDLKINLATDGEDGLSDAIGVFAEKKMYGKSFMGLIRSTFLIDKKGVVAKAWPKVKVTGHAEEVLAAAQELAAQG